MRKAVKLTGLLLIFSGLFILALVFFPLVREEYQYKKYQKKISNPRYRSLRQEIEPISREFGLVIPKLNINAKVFPRISDQNPAEYRPVLQEGVAHARGSVFPGEQGVVFLFAHSANSPVTINRFNAVFYLIDKLENGDLIHLFYRGDKFDYEVSQKVIMSPDEVKKYDWDLVGQTLVLQTCYPPGTTLYRLLVFAEIASKTD